jgi:hypothetical protein
MVGDVMAKASGWPSASAYDLFSLARFHGHRPFSASTSRTITSL